MTVTDNIRRILEFRQTQGWPSKEIRLSARLAKELKRETGRLYSLLLDDLPLYQSVGLMFGIPVVEDKELDSNPRTPADQIRVLAEVEPDIYKDQPLGYSIVLR